MSGSYYLVFETSTPRASLAGIEADGRLELRSFTGDRSHNAVLFSPLQALLDHRETEKIGLVLVGSGPGSYSGTRVGIAAAQGVAIASNCPAVAVPSILAVPAADDGASCLAIGDARRGSYWTAAIADSNLITEPQLTDANGLTEIVASAVAAGRPVFSFESPSKLPLPAELIDQVRLETPDAARLWHAWNRAGMESRTRWLACAPQPAYLKPPHITPAKRPWLVQPQG
jgi:tRNA threonylcarbamoyladenosine biosynthesis protein TsaB